MRCSGWSSLAISVCSALVLAGSVNAHVVATPAFLASESSGSISFSGPNERDAPMAAFTLTAPAGLEITRAHEVDGWAESFAGSTASWTGGSLARGREVSFGVDLQAARGPGVVELRAEQRYADGAVVAWPVTLTITPAKETPSQNLALAGIVGLGGVLAAVGIAMLAWRRRTR